MQKRYLQRIILAAAASSIIPNITYAAAPTADQDQPEFHLAEEIVTATRTPQKSSKVNADVTVVTAKQIEQHHYRNALAALADVPGITVMQHAPVAYQSSNKLYLNGTANVVVCVNGIKQNISGVSSAQILNMYNDMGNIERIEVLHGSASTLYGSDAEGGVINIITKKITKPATVIAASYGSYNTSKYSIDTQAVTPEGLAYRLFYQGNHQGNYRDAQGHTWQPHQKDSTKALMLSQALNDEHDVLTFSYNQSDYSSRYRALWEPRLYMANPTQKNYSLAWEHHFDSTANNQFVIARNHVENKNWLNGYSDLVVSSYRFTDQFNKKIGRHSISIGAEHTSNNLRDHFNDSVIPTKQITTNSLYLQDQYQLTDALSLTGGLRYDHNSQFGKHYSPAFTIGYRQGKTHLYASYSGYYIAPTPYQLYSSYGDAQLQPETGYTKALGFDYTFDKKNIFTANYFIRHSKDIIGFNKKTWYYDNLADKTSVKGWNASFKHQFNDFLDTNISYTHTAMATDVANALYAPNSEYTVGLNYHNRALSASLSGNARIGIATAARATPVLPCNSYWVWNLNTNYQLSENKSIYLSINNLFNKYYADFSNVQWGGAPGEWWANAGRNFTVGFKCQF